MRGVYHFAVMTLYSLFRRRTVWGVAILTALSLAGLASIPAYGLSGGGRFTVDTGLTSIEIGSLVLAIVLASGIFPKDRDTRIAFPILAAPLSRTQYLLGRYMGTALVQIAFIALWGAGLTAIIALKGYPMPSGLGGAVLLLGIEGCFLLAVVFFFSFWTSPPLNAPLTILLFILSQMSVRDFTGLLPGAEGPMRLLRLLLPHMDSFHIKDPVTHGFDVSPLYILLASLYGLAYTAFMLSLARSVLLSRDLR